MRKLPSMLIMVALLAGMMLLAAHDGAATEPETVAEATVPVASDFK
jgi:hypothetical protein